MRVDWGFIRTCTILLASVSGLITLVVFESAYDLVLLAVVVFGSIGFIAAVLGEMWRIGHERNRPDNR